MSFGDTYIAEVTAETQAPPNTRTTNAISMSPVAFNSFFVLRFLGIGQSGRAENLGCCTLGSQQREIRTLGKNETEKQDT